MKRRAMSLGLAGLAVGPFAAISRAAAQGRRARVGLLAINSPGQSDIQGTWREDLLQNLDRLGYKLGSTLELIDRYSDSDVARLPALAREIAAANADVCVAVSNDSVRAMLAATTTTPVVMVVGGDPAEFVASLARPGGRVTGIALQTAEGDAKRLQFLREAIPSARRFGYLRPPGPVPARAATLMTDASRQLNVEVVTRAAARLDVAAYEEAFAALRRDGAAGVLIASTAAFSGHAGLFGPVAQSLGLPTICEWDHMARKGCVLAYGHDLGYARRRVGEYVARILKGAVAGDLPVEQSDAWKLTANLAAARASGLILPSALLGRVHELVE